MNCGTLNVYPLPSLCHYHYSSINPFTSQVHSFIIIPFSLILLSNNDLSCLLKTAFANSVNRTVCVMNQNEQNVLSHESRIIPKVMVQDELAKNERRVMIVIQWVVDQFSGWG